MRRTSPQGSGLTFVSKNQVSQPFSRAAKVQPDAGANNQTSLHSDPLPKLTSGRGRCENETLHYTNSGSNSSRWRAHLDPLSAVRLQSHDTRLATGRGTDPKPHRRAAGEITANLVVPAIGNQVDPESYQRDSQDKARRDGFGQEHPTQQDSEQGSREIEGADLAD